jgi:hypothetical protein
VRLLDEDLSGEEGVERRDIREMHVERAQYLTRWGLRHFGSQLEVPKYGFCM